MRLSGSVSLRPVRLGFLVPPADLALVRRVAQLSACLWGGRYNPIIPFFEDAHTRWIAPYHGAQGLDVARGYVDFFEPDVLVEASAGMAEQLGWHNGENEFHLPRVVSLQQFYEVDDRGRVEFAAGIDVTNVMQHLYDREYKYQRRHKILFAAVESDSDCAFFDLFFGTYPDDTALKYIADAYREIFEPEILPYNATTWHRIINENIAGPSWISRHNLEEDLGRGGSDFTVFIFDPANANDAIDYWNYRLWKRQVLPVNVHWLVDHAAFLRDQISKHHRPIPGNPFGTMFWSHIDFARSISDEEAKQILKNHFDGLPKNSFAWGRDQEIWALTKSRDRWRQSRILIKAKSKSFDTEITESKNAKIPTLAPEFHNATGTYAKAHWMNVVSPSSTRLDDGPAIVYPSNLWHPKPPGTTISRELTVTREGWTLPRRQDIGYTLLRPSSGRDAVTEWFADNGIEAHPSEEGQVAAQVIAAAGSLLGCGMFADADTLSLLNKMAESHAERSRGGRPVKATGPDRAKHLDLIRQHFQRREKQGFGYWTRLDYFLKRSVFRAGLRVQCPTCAHHNWFDLGAMGYVLTCTRCLKQFNFSQTPSDLARAQWFYRVIGPFAAPNYAHGGYAVALTLRCLSENRENELTWSTGLNLNELNREIDFVAWYRRSSTLGGEREEPFFLFGEAKSFGKNVFDEDVVTGLRDVAERFPGAVLVVSSLRPIADYTSAELKNLSELASWGRTPTSDWRPRNPVIVLTATELFSDNTIAYAWKQAGGRAAELVQHASVDLSDLYVLAEATQQLYLGLPSFYDGYGSRLRRERQRLVQLLRARSVSST